MLESILFSALSPAGRSARLSTLIFHRVLPRTDPLFPLEADAQRFDRVCAWISQWFNVLPLDDAVRHLREGSLPARAMAITFDDGYEDNYSVALPILQRHGLTATFFIATGYLDGGRMWNDTIIESLRRTKHTELNLAAISDQVSGRLDLRTLEARGNAIRTTLGQAKYLAPGARADFSSRIADLAEVDPPRDLMMTSNQVQALASAGMQVGAHTVSHPILASLAESAARVEMTDSRHRLEDLIGTPVMLFAYPNGRPGDDYGEREVRLARECGFLAAMSTAWGVADGRADPFQLPRFTPWGLTRWRFCGQLARNLLAGPLDLTRSRGRFGA